MKHLLVALTVVIGICVTPVSPARVMGLSTRHIVHRFSLDDRSLPTTIATIRTMAVGGRQIILTCVDKYLLIYASSAPDPHTTSCTYSCCYSYYGCCNSFGSVYWYAW